ncbi:hypothetical protein, partial [Pigmentiphaga daeguensis]|uniref:hypothetical protein n=1 Tax=Pigmentiphaga daeguensis TaxID=414049 RepID=UPI0031DA4607
MAADDKQNGNAKGFSGLSTLVSDVDEGSPAGESTPQVVGPDLFIFADEAAADRPQAAGSRQDHRLPNT